MDRRTLIAASLASTLPLSAPAHSKAAMSPPVAPQRPHSFTRFGITVEDPYAWLRDPGYPKVTDKAILAHLEAENAWFRHWMHPHAARVEALFEELKGRVNPEDSSVPFPDGQWEYWWAFEKGGQYRQWYRRPRGGTGQTLILSEPALAEGREYFRLGALTASPDGRLLAYSYDDTGDERFTLVVRDMETGRDLETVATDSLGQPAWTADSRGLVWAQTSPEWRPDRVRLHRLGTPAGSDPLLYQEKGDFFTSVGQTQDRRWILIEASQSATTEIHLVDARNPTAPPRLVRARKTAHQYSVDGRGDTLFILSNETNPNFVLHRASAAQPDRWTQWMEGSPTLYLRSVTPFASYTAIEERLDGLDQVRLVFPDGRERRIAFPEASYTASLGSNAEADAPHLRLGYASMVTPQTVFDYDVAADRLVTRKVQEIPSGYDASRYATERLMATARDGTRVPVSVVYRRDYRRDGSMPLHVYGYGSYGIAMPPGFSAARLSLLDRGFAYAIAHIRGGSDLGYTWYLDGKLDRKANTFNDFIDVTRHLHAAGFGRPAITSASGGSAGGFLMGVIANQAPELYGALVAHVPFVDVLNTMLDATLPLTPGEFPEWGNPAESEEIFRRLLALSPYDNVRAQDYPAMLVTAGLNDPRVTYWEPAKWVARLRERRTDSNPLLLKTNMGAGHGGRSGRFEALRETAEEFAFLLAIMEPRLKPA